MQVAHEVGRPVPAVAPDRSRRPGRFSLSRRGSISSRGGAGSGAGSGGNTSARGPSRSVSRAAHVIPPAQAGLQTAVVPLTTAVDAIILGSRGFWCAVNTPELFTDLSYRFKMQNTKLRLSHTLIDPENPPLASQPE